MKRIVLIIAMCLVAFNASAQYAVMDGQELSVRFGRVYSDGVKLTDAQATAVFATLDDIDGDMAYMEYRKKYKTGAWLTAGGVVGSLAGAFMGMFGLILAVSEPVGVSPEEITYNANAIGRMLLIGGGVVFWGSVGCEIAGERMLKRNNTNLKSLARTYNAYSRTGSPSGTPAVELSFGPTVSGFGLALNF